MRGYHLLHAMPETDQRRLVEVAASAETLACVEQSYRAALRDFDLANLAEAESLSNIVSVEAIQAALSPDETLVELYAVAGSLCAFIVTRSSIRVMRELASAEEVCFGIRRLRYNLQRTEMLAGYVQKYADQILCGLRGALQQLYRLLLQPIAAEIATDKVVLVPHGTLHGVPFHALYDGERYALDKWEFLYAPSAAVWHAGATRERTRIAGDRALIVGVPAPGIEHVAAEVAQVSRLLPSARTLCGEEATLAAFKQHAPESGLIHLATHAIYRADNPLFSGLRLADGWLLARDLYDITLSCELATLSACRTGAVFVEPGDELFGLIRGFLSAGARSLAVSLWPADDAATAALMSRFYDLLRNGLSGAAAMRAAQIAVRDKYPNPYHWAAFALVGER